RQPLSQAVHALAMQRVDRDPILSRELPKQSARLEGYLVRGTVLDFQLAALVFAVVHFAFDVMDLLMEGPAEGDVHFLESAADAQYGHTRGDSLADQRQRGRIPGRIVQGSRVARRSGVVMRLYVRGASGEYQAIQARKQ